MIDFRIGDTLYIVLKSATIRVRILDATFFTFLDELKCNLKIERTLEDSQGKHVMTTSVTMNDLGRWLQDGKWQVQPGSPVQPAEEEAAT